MTRIALLLLIALVCTAPAHAQEEGDKARLDDFALPAASEGSAIEQIGADPLPEPQVQVRDRQLSIPAATAAQRAPIDQLSQAGVRESASQLSDPAESRELADRSVSSTGDSRPQAIAALSGEDRCEPGKQADRTEECARILERRANEFSATEAPRLSPEQVLLAEQMPNGDALAATSARFRLMLASSAAPDADKQSNQELAAIFLDTSASQVPPAREEPAPEGDTALAAILEGLQIDVSGGTAP